MSKTIVLDREGVPYSARLQMKYVSFLIRHLHVCLALFLAACLLHVSARFLAAGCTVHCRTGCCFPIKSLNRKLQVSVGEQ